MFNMIHAAEAHALVKDSKKRLFTYEPFIARMSEEIRKAAKSGKTYVIVDLVEYTYHFNISLKNKAYEHLMHIMMNIARRHRFNCEEIICDGEYVFKISWAEN